MATPNARPPSVMLPLALAATALVMYASLHPFIGWNWPPGHSVWDLLTLPWPRFRGRFDVVSNVLGYALPGLLFYSAAIVRGASRVRALLLAMACCAALSYAMEVTQSFLPGRVPSLLDWLLNVGGGAIGALFGAALHATGLLARWQNTRGRWLTRPSGGARALLLMWPLGLLFPAPIPFAIGPSWERLQPVLSDGLFGVSWAQGALDIIEGDLITVQPLSLAAESVAVTLGLLAPCLLAYAMAPTGWRRLWHALAISAVGFAATTLSAALNFGPDHALAWITPAVVPGFAVAMLCALLLAPVPHRVAAAVGCVAMGTLLTLVLQAPSDPYFAQSLQAWEQGGFIRFHGFAQWVGWLWPLATLGWLIWRTFIEPPVR